MNRHNVRAYPNPDDVRIEWTDDVRVVARAELLDLLRSAGVFGSVVLTIVPERRRL